MARHRAVGAREPRLRLPGLGLLLSSEHGRFARAGPFPSLSPLRGGVQMISCLSSALLAPREEGVRMGARPLQLPQPGTVPADLQVTTREKRVLGAEEPGLLERLAPLRVTAFLEEAVSLQSPQARIGSLLLFGEEQQSQVSSISGVGNRTQASTATPAPSLTVRPQDSSWAPLSLGFLS